MRVTSIENEQIAHSTSSSYFLASETTTLKHEADPEKLYDQATSRNPTCGAKEMTSD